MTLLIYGGNGYTGELVCRRAVRLGVPIIVAGRSAGPVLALAQELGAEARVFELSDGAALTAALAGVRVVLNSAGPFARTAAPWVEACLRERVHYLDVTAELSVLEALAARGAEASSRGITILPGAGFDVVPSDCLAAEAKHRLPSATHLTLAFEVGGRVSRGTATTAIENIHAGGFVRRGGALVTVPSGYKSRRIDFGQGPRHAITIPWGDLSTAYHSTGIPNIEVYAAGSAAQRAIVRAARWLGPVLASRPAQRAMLRVVARQSPGPTPEERRTGSARLWAEAHDDAGHRVTLRLTVPEPYELTSWTALELASRASRGELPPGYQTPSTACGREFITGFPSVFLEEVR